MIPLAQASPAIIIFICALLSRCLAFSLVPRTTPATITTHRFAHSKFHAPQTVIDPAAVHQLHQLSGDWHTAKESLRNPNCCVVTVPGLNSHLSVVQQYFCQNDAPTDLDLRMRVRCGNNYYEAAARSSYEDCAKIYSAVMKPSLAKDAINFENNRGENYDLSRDDSQNNNGVVSDENLHPCILALEELARGVASLADGPLEGTCTDVHVRVVCASNYKAIDPMYHTDKCPLRGYVTLTGPGTEYMDQTCAPWEYAALRSFGVDGLSYAGGSGDDEGKVQSLKMAKELEFIVMKGDHYDAPLPDGMAPSMADKILGKVWNRSSACVHRSPPGNTSPAKSAAIAKDRRRVILSLDLADGTDDQEWYEVSRKRGWRSGMTQRKSRLVS